MKIFAIGDLHLARNPNIDKPMDIFGRDWDSHDIKLEQNWKNTVSDEDVVLIPGDISWALRFSEVIMDLDWIDSLPGKKIITKGNHDLWWNGINKMNTLYDKTIFLQNTSYDVGDYIICGSRGWVCPGTEGFTAQDEKIYKRELLRMEYSLEHAASDSSKPIIIAMHYPPTNDKLQESGFTKLFRQYNVKHVVYGHLHGRNGFSKGLKGSRDGIAHHLVSLDYIKANPLLIVE